MDSNDRNQVSDSNYAGLRKASLELARTVRAGHYPPGSQIAGPDYTAIRVGRNKVWRVRAASWPSSIFLKLWFEPQEMARELEGLRLAREIATEAPQLFVAPQVVYVEKDQGILTLAEMPGRPVSDLVRLAYRRDFMLRRTLADVQRAAQAISGVFRWLDAFHARKVDENAPVYDHSVRKIRLRSCRKVEQLLTQRVSPSLQRARRGLLQMEGAGDRNSPRLIFGDCTLGNFFFDGERSGAIDYEDIGLGDPARDELFLCNEFDQLRKNWAYGAEGLPHFAWPEAVVPEARVVMELELLLLELEQALNTRGSFAWIERSRVERKISRCMDQLD